MKSDNIKQPWVMFYLIICGCFFMSCSSKESGSGKSFFSKNYSGEIKHPLKQFMPYNEDIKKVDTEASLAFTKVFNELNSSKFQYSIGRYNESMDDIFGDITDVATDSEGNIYIIDNRKPSLRKYSRQGKLLDIYQTQRGKGPDDLHSPKALAISDSNLIYVADSFNQIKIFESPGDSIIFKETFLTPEIIATDICILQDNLYIRTLSNNKTLNDTTIYNMVHVFSLEDNSYKSVFGDTYNSPRINTNMRLSGGMGKIACIESTYTVAYNYQSFPFIYAYSGQGEFKWASEIGPDFFEQPEVTETVQSGMTVRWSFDYSGSIINNLIYLNNYVYVIYNTFDSDTKEVITKGVILSSDTGSGLIPKSEMPWFLHFDKDLLFKKKVDGDVLMNVDRID